MSGHHTTQAKNYKMFKSCIDNKLDSSKELLITTNNIKKIKDRLVNLYKDFFNIMNTYKETASEFINTYKGQILLGKDRIMIHKLKKLFN